MNTTFKLKKPIVFEFGIEHPPPSLVCFRGGCMVSDIDVTLAILRNSRSVVNLCINISGCLYLLHI